MIFTHFVIIRHPAEFTLEWRQQEYTAMESDTRDTGRVTITYPSGGSFGSANIVVTYQDISATGGET
jgi:hypothetical protein